MKRSEAIQFIKSCLGDIDACSQSYCEQVDDAAVSILNQLEELGMLPPIQAPSLVDCPDGTQKHGPSLRVWDEE